VIQQPQSQHANFVSWLHGFLLNMPDPAGSK
jgi:hypothetical protein